MAGRGRPRGGPSSRFTLHEGLLDREASESADWEREEVLDLPEEGEAGAPVEVLPARKLSLEVRRAAIFGLACRWFRILGAQDLPNVWTGSGSVQGARASRPPADERVG